MTRTLTWGRRTAVVIAQICSSLSLSSWLSRIEVGRLELAHGPGEARAHRLADRDRSWATSSLCEPPLPNAIVASAVEQSFGGPVAGYAVGSHSAAPRDHDDLVQRRRACTATAGSNAISSARAPCSSARPRRASPRRRSRRAASPNCLPAVELHAADPRVRLVAARLAADDQHGRGDAAAEEHGTDSAIHGHLLGHSRRSSPCFGAEVPGSSSSARSLAVAARVVGARPRFAADGRPCVDLRIAEHRRAAGAGSRRARRRHRCSAASRMLAHVARALEPILRLLGEDCASSRPRRVPAASMPDALGGFGASERCFVMISKCVLPSNGVSPTSDSYSVAPSE